ncbi:MAG: hypothetical protein QXU98_06835, partial [Candidatus Parvarchaeota archaeon]
MPVRSVIRPSIPGRIRNPYYSQPATAPYQANPQTAVYQYKQQSQSLSLNQTPTQMPSSGLGGHLPYTANIATPQGNVSLLFANGTPQITKNITFTQNINQSLGNGITERGTMTYTYAIKGNQLVAVPIASTVKLYYQSPHQQQVQQQAEQALAMAQNAKQQYTYFENYTLPQEIAQINAMQNNPAVMNALFQSMEAQLHSVINQYFGLNNNYPGQFAGSSAVSVLQSAPAVIAANAPVPFAYVGPHGNVHAMNVTVSDEIYGNVGGQVQELGVISLKPSVVNNAVSLVPTGFSPSLVTLSGKGWQAAVYPQFNAQTGTITINPHNYAWVTGNAVTNTLANGEVITTITMPSGFGLAEQFGPGALNYINIANIPVQSSIGGYTATESYTQKGTAPGVYSLTNPGTFPAAITQTFAIGKGITETVSATRNFNPLTGAITYSNSSTLNVPGIGNVALSSLVSNPLNFVYQGQQYSLSFNKATNAFSITALPTLAMSIAVPMSRYSSPPTAATTTEEILYQFTPNGRVSGYEVLSSSGKFISGANYLTPLYVAGSSSVSQPTVEGNTLVLPMSQYNQYISTQGANSIVVQENAAVKKTLGSTAGSIFTSSWNPFYQIYQAGTLWGMGYHTAAIPEIESSVETAVAYAGVVAGGYSLLAQGGITALGATSASILGTRAATGASISIGLGEASSYVSTGSLMSPRQTVVAGALGATTGIIFGAAGAPTGQSILDAVGYTALQIGRKAIAPMVAFFAGQAAVEGVVAPSTWMNNTSIASGLQNRNTQQQQQVSQSQVNQSATSASLLLNEGASYLSFVGKSALSGASFGAEFGGAFSAVGALGGSAVKAIAPGLASTIQASPFLSRLSMSAINVAVVGGLGLASGQPLRETAAATAVAAAFPFAWGYAGDFFSTAPRGKPVVEGSTIINVRYIPEEVRGTLITETVNGATIQEGSYGSIEYRIRYPTVSYDNAVVKTSG